MDEAFELAQSAFRDKGRSKTDPAVSSAASATETGEEQPAVEEGIPPQGAAATDTPIGIHSEVSPPLDESYVLGTMKQFQSL